MGGRHIHRHHVVAQRILPELLQVHLRELVAELVKIREDFGDVLDVEEGVRGRVVARVPAGEPTKVQRAFVVGPAPIRLAGLRGAFPAETFSGSFACRGERGSAKVARNDAYVIVSANL